MLNYLSNAPLEPIEIRKMGILLLDAVSKNEVQDRDGVIRFLQEKLNLSVTSEYELKGNDLLRSLLLKAQNGQNARGNHQYSSIHKAKGLEANSVLAVARNKNELLHWLVTDKDARAGDNSDACRIGYVAFTRAKTLLCIACLEPLDENVKQILNQTEICLAKTSVEGKPII